MGRSAMRTARRLVVHGRVQGVGFRFFTEAAARRAGVTGWVRNLADGAVEAYVEGDAAAVETVERAIRQGPPAARVEAVDVIEETPGRVRGFAIR
jgi:acylphosphatase